MNSFFAPSVLYGYLFPEASPSISRRLSEFKDLSAGGACETGYGDQTKIHKTLQRLADLKHKEKHIPYLRWAVTVMPALLDALPRIIHHNNKYTPLRDIPDRTYTLLKEKISRISTDSTLAISGCRSHLIEQAFKELGRN